MNIQTVVPFGQTPAMQIEPADPACEMLHSTHIPRCIKVGDLVLDLLQRAVYKDNKKLLIGGQRFQVLLYLTLRSAVPGPVSRNQIGTWIYGREQTKSNVIEMNICRVRAELDEVGSTVIICTAAKQKGYWVTTKPSISA